LCLLLIVKCVTDISYIVLQAREYIEFRVEPVVAFYQSKLPHYYNSRVASEAMILLGALTGTILAFLKLAKWAAIATAAAGAGECSPQT
jgi:hypothetical protein